VANIGVISKIKNDYDSYDVIVVTRSNNYFIHRGNQIRDTIHTNNGVQHLTKMTIFIVLSTIKR